ncbi:MULTISPECIES: phasin family protein [Legionella]|uniref:Phasin family protein n=1 Tax=Legionella septentrionalis TaxID=2498109 RepID=A0A433JLH6_9GAMM|nr:MULTISPECIES: phasin family protein [Legionella]MCP0913951.1 phasin family protein [Legionella sp. 27cVA30]RUQ90388.1 phasin family protein [Legionella septentrionalis]RUR00039.1 phasin family protein [Legionella septentrionalis]RUR10735.1 phasin family protein [Legionella septentrionalis]RUR16512.1 phasin family protein [Legionella septentrionalis]
MNREYFEKLSDMAKKAQAPFQAWAELNVKTLQSFSYVKPDEFANIKKPEELFEKQMQMWVENGHKALDYMQKSFQIYEKAMLSLMQETKQQSETKN